MQLVSLAPWLSPSSNHAVLNGWWWWRWWINEQTNEWMYSCRKLLSSGSRKLMAYSHWASSFFFFFFSLYISLFLYLSPPTTEMIKVRCRFCTYLVYGLSTHFARSLTRSLTHSFSISVPVSISLSVSLPSLIHYNSLLAACFQSTSPSLSMGTWNPPTCNPR